MTRYRMKKDATTEPKATAGAIVYACAHHDYGLARDDTRMTGTPHISVTMKSDGGYPFFTVPEDSLEEVAE